MKKYIIDEKTGLKCELEGDYYYPCLEAPEAEGQPRIYTHGEKEIFAYADRMKNGINVNINTVAEMKNLCDYLGMDSVKYLGYVDLSSAKQSSYK